MLKTMTKSLFRKFGFEVYRVRPSKISSPDNSFDTQALPNNPFDAQRELLAGMGLVKPVIFDIGANKGQTVENYKARFGEPIIYCFEPFPNSIKVLNERYGSDPHVNVIAHGSCRYTWNQGILCERVC